MINETYKMKCALLHYLRFKRQAFVATEVSYSLGNADVLFIPKKDKKVYEVECKISKSDFLNEWKKKERKHYMLEKCNYNLNYFYFCVPKKLETFALEQIKDKPYGLMIYEEIWTHKNKLQEKLELTDCIFIKKNAKDLLKEDNKYFNMLKDLICLRSMTEVATLYKEQIYGGNRNKIILRDK
jgi:hypothetical protein